MRMIQVNIAGLVEAVQKASPFVMPEMDAGTSYLFNNLYTRLANNETVQLSELDFAAFEYDDIQTLSSLYDNVFEKNSHQAISIIGTLRNAAPVSKAAAYI